jgi:glycosyltransferase involved in cell wall biosynthesis
MKILFITKRLEWPPTNGGSIRAWNILKMLAKNHDIYVLSYGKKSIEEEVNIITSKRENHIIVPDFMEKMASLCRMAFSIFSNNPLTVAKYKTNKFKKRIDELLEKHDISMVFCDSVHMADTAFYVGKKIIFDMHNVEYLIWKRIYENTNNRFYKWISSYQWPKLMKYEKYVASKAVGIISVSDNEAKIWEDFGAKKTRIVPNGTNIVKEIDINTVGHSPKMLFVGSLDWYPNQNGIIWFMDNIFPKLKANIPNITLTIVGRNPNAIFKKYKYDDKIKIIGYVRSVDEYYRSHNIFIVPLKIGAGTRLKILEAMSYKLPIISTSIGCEGLEIIPGHHIMVADSLSEWDKAVEKITTDIEFTKNMISNSVNLINTTYGWNAIENNCADVIKLDWV